MLKANDVCKQISRLTADLISIGVCTAQNFPSIKEHSGKVSVVGLSNSDNAIFLKNIPYADMFEQLDKDKAYHIKMLDGAILTMQYTFVSDEIQSHRLSFFPSPNLEAFQNEPDIYYEDELYADILDKRIVTVPLRFDFDKSDATCEPIEHPISHLTIGQYKNCRIPVTSALTPYQFISFILMNFYSTANHNFGDKVTSFKDRFETTLFEEEKEI